ncbi:MAG: molecular chaperone DnaJ [Candidatus Omnitrophica bacterium]|nr:molecular chaperone DnaJ [Candidatus Omnitrophota bacterium]
MTKRDYYEILGVSKTAAAEEVKKSYRRLAMQHHPDRNPGDKTAETKFKEASEAYAVLSDGEKRAQYDQFGHSLGGRGFQGFEGFEDSFRGFGDVFGDIFEDFFGGSSSGRGSRGGSRSRRGSDLEMGVEIELEDVLNGKKVTLEIPRRETCSDCDGGGSAPGAKKQTCSMCAGRGEVRVSQGFFTLRQTCTQCQGEGSMTDKQCPKCQGQGRVRKTRKLEIQIPPGMESQSRLKVTGEGEAGMRDGGRGDLYLVVMVKDHALFERRESDLYIEVLAPFTTLALGGKISVPTLEEEETLEIPPSTPSAKIFKISGLGLPMMRNPKIRGEIYVRVDVEVPKKMTPEEKELLKELAKLRGEITPQKKKGIFDRIKGNL